MFLAKNQFAHTGMEPVGPHDQIELPGASACKPHPNATLCLVDAVQGIAKYGFDPAFNLAEDRRRQFGSRQGNKPALCYPRKYVR